MIRLKRLFVYFFTITVIVGTGYYVADSLGLFGPKYDYDFEKNLGNDEIGTYAAIIIKREAGVQGLTLEDETVCSTLNTCPVALLDLYRVALHRLDEALELKAKVYLQAQMLKSDLPLNDKWSTLAGTVVNSKIHKLEPQSTRTEDGKIVLKEDMQYVALTSTQLRQIAPSREEYLRVIFQILARSRDQIARQMIAESLNKHFPAYEPMIRREAAKQGIHLQHRTPPPDAQMNPPVPSPRKNRPSTRQTASTPDKKITKRKSAKKKQPTQQNKKQSKRKN